LATTPAYCPRVMGATTPRRPGLGGMVEPLGLPDARDESRNSSRRRARSRCRAAVSFHCLRRPRARAARSPSTITARRSSPRRTTGKACVGSSRPSRSCGERLPHEGSTSSPPTCCGDRSPNTGSNLRKRRCGALRAAPCSVSHLSAASLPYFASTAAARRLSVPVAGSSGSRTTGNGARGVASPAQLVSDTNREPTSAGGRRHSPPSKSGLPHEGVGAAELISGELSKE